MPDICPPHTTYCGPGDRSAEDELIIIGLDMGRSYTSISFIKISDGVAPQPPSGSDIRSVFWFPNFQTHLHVEPSDIDRMPTNLLMVAESISTATETSPSDSEYNDSSSDNEEESYQQSCPYVRKGVRCYTGFEAEVFDPMNEQSYLIGGASLTAGDTGDETLNRLRQSSIITKKGADVCEHFFAHVLSYAKHRITSMLRLDRDPKFQVLLGASIEWTTEISESIFRALEVASLVLSKGQNVTCSMKVGLEAAAQCILEGTGTALNVSEFSDFVSVS